MRLPFAAFIILAALLAAACGAGPRNPAVGSWDLAALVVDGDEVPALETNVPSLILDADVSGSGGCNSFRGQYDVSGDSLAFRDIASTLRACAEADRNEQESRFFAALDATRTFDRDGDELRFFDSSGAMLARFKR